MATKHTIDRVDLDFSFDVPVFHGDSDLTSWVRSELLVAADEVLCDHDDGSMVVLDRLEFDLGEVESRQARTEIVERFRQQLDRALRGLRRREGMETAAVRETSSLPAAAKSDDFYWTSSENELLARHARMDAPHLHVLLEALDVWQGGLRHPTPLSVKFWKQVDAFAKSKRKRRFPGRDQAKISATIRAYAKNSPPDWDGLLLALASSSPESDAQGIGALETKEAVAAQVRIDRTVPRSQVHAQEKTRHSLEEPEEPQQSRDPWSQLPRFERSRQPGEGAIPSIGRGASSATINGKVPDAYRSALDPFLDKIPQLAREVFWESLHRSWELAEDKTTFLRMVEEAFEAGNLLDLEAFVRQSRRDPTRSAVPARDNPAHGSPEGGRPAGQRQPSTEEQASETDAAEPESVELEKIAGAQRTGSSRDSSGSVNSIGSGHSFDEHRFDTRFDEAIHRLQPWVGKISQPAQAVFLESLHRSLEFAEDKSVFLRMVEDAFEAGNFLDLEEFLRRSRRASQGPSLKVQGISGQDLSEGPIPNSQSQREDSSAIRSMQASSAMTEGWIEGTSSEAGEDPALSPLVKGWQESPRDQDKRGEVTPPRSGIPSTKRQGSESTQTDRTDFARASERVAPGHLAQGPASVSLAAAMREETLLGNGGRMQEQSIDEGGRRSLDGFSLPPKEETIGHQLSGNDADAVRELDHGESSYGNQQAAKRNSSEKSGSLDPQHSSEEDRTDGRFEAAIHPLHSWIARIPQTARKAFLESLRRSWELAEDKTAFLRRVEDAFTAGILLDLDGSVGRSGKAQPRRSATSIDRPGHGVLQGERLEGRSQQEDPHPIPAERTSFGGAEGEPERVSLVGTSPKLDEPLQVNRRSDQDLSPLSLPVQDPTRQRAEGAFSKAGDDPFLSPSVNAGLESPPDPDKEGEGSRSRSKAPIDKRQGSESTQPDRIRIARSSPEDLGQGKSSQAHQPGALRDSSEPSVSLDQGASFEEDQFDAIVHPLHPWFDKIPPPARTVFLESLRRWWELAEDKPAFMQRVEDAFTGGIPLDLEEFVRMSKATKRGGSAIAMDRPGHGVLQGERLEGRSQQEDPHPIPAERTFSGREEVETESTSLVGTPLKDAQTVRDSRRTNQDPSPHSLFVENHERQSTERLLSDTGEGPPPSLREEAELRSSLDLEHEGDLSRPKSKAPDAKRQGSESILSDRTKIANASEGVAQVHSLPVPSSLLVAGADQEESSTGIGGRSDATVQGEGKRRSLAEPQSVPREENIGSDTSENDAQVRENHEHGSRGKVHSPTTSHASSGPMDLLGPGRSWERDRSESRFEEALPPLQPWFDKIPPPARTVFLESLRRWWELAEDKPAYMQRVEDAFTAGIPLDLEGFVRMSKATKRGGAAIAMDRPGHGDPQGERLEGRAKREDLPSIQAERTFSGREEAELRSSLDLEHGGDLSRPKSKAPDTKRQGSESILSDRTKIAKTLEGVAQVHSLPVPSSLLVAGADQEESSTGIGGRSDATVQGEGKRRSLAELQSVPREEHIGANPSEYDAQAREDLEYGSRGQVQSPTTSHASSGSMDLLGPGRSWERDRPESRFDETLHSLQPWIDRIPQPARAALLESLRRAWELAEEKSVFLRLVEKAFAEEGLLDLEEFVRRSERNQPGKRTTEYDVNGSAALEVGGQAGSRLRADSSDDSSQVTSLSSPIGHPAKGVEADSEQNSGVARRASPIQSQPTRTILPSRPDVILEVPPADRPEVRFRLAKLLAQMDPQARRILVARIEKSHLRSQDPDRLVQKVVTCLECGEPAALEDLLESPEHSQDLQTTKTDIHVGEGTKPEQASDSASSEAWKQAMEPKEDSRSMKRTLSADPSTEPIVSPVPSDLILSQDAAEAGAAAPKQEPSFHALAMELERKLAQELPEIWEQARLCADMVLSLVEKFLPWNQSDRTKLLSRQIIFDRYASGQRAFSHRDAAQELVIAFAKSYLSIDRTNLAAMVQRRLILPPFTAPREQAKTPESAKSIDAVREIQVSEGLAVPCAGIVITAPYLPRLFQMLELLQDGKFIQEEAMGRALRLVRYTASGMDQEEGSFALERVLCGVAPDAAVPPGEPLPDRDRQMADQMLGAIIQNWKALGKTSVAGLRETFLMRSGWLKKTDEFWQLRVQNGTFDMLLDKLPWGISMVKYPWMDLPMNVEWR